MSSSQERFHYYYRLAQLFIEMKGQLEADLDAIGSVSYTDDLLILQDAVNDGLTCSMVIAKAIKDQAGLPLPAQPEDAKGVRH